MKTWKDAFSRSRLAPSIFIVKGDGEAALSAWLDKEGIPSFQRSGVFSPTITAWGVLDAGIVEMYAYGMACLPTATRVIGFNTVRLLLDAFDLPQPKQFTGERALPDIALLRRQHADRAAPASEVARQGELLLDSFDGPSLLWTTRALLGDEALSPARGPRHPAAGEWGDSGFMQVAADLLDGKLAPGEALLLLTSSGEAIQPPYGIVEAELALALFAIPADVRSDFRRCGLSASITVVAAESGSSLADVQEWIAVGCPAGPWLLQSALASPVQPEQARPFLAAGAGLPMSLEMSAVGVDPAEFARLAPSAEDSHTLAEELICMRLGMQPD